MLAMLQQEQPKLEVEVVALTPLPHRPSSSYVAWSKFLMWSLFFCVVDILCVVSNTGFFSLGLPLKVLSTNKLI